MIELNLKGYTSSIKLSDSVIQRFKKPIIFYMVNKNDVRPFFITFVIINFMKSEILYLFSYNQENIEIINAQPNNKKFSFDKNPHCALCINEGEDFLAFMDNEEFFVYINYKTMIMKVYSMNDIVKNTDIKYKRISSTFYKDDSDKNFFYMSAVDSSNLLHIFRVSLTLDNIEEIDTFPSNPFPPHVLRKHKDFLLLSHEFKYSKFELQKNGKIVSQDELARIFLKHTLQLLYSQQRESTSLQQDNIKLSKKNAKELFKIIKENYNIRCLPGSILALNLNTKEKVYYNTMGGSPAHFEIDLKDDVIYTSSHNFLSSDTLGGLVYIEPAVIDKFKMNGSKLELVGTFSNPKGFRYTTHKIFYYNNKPYICVFGQPNRLMFIDATTMELMFYEDISEDELTNQSDLSIYLNTRDNEFDLAAIEVSEDGECIIFVGPDYIYFYNFPQKKLIKKIDYKLFSIPNDNISLSDYKIRTAHMNYLD